jgi:hypothetical protein
MGSATAVIKQLIIIDGKEENQPDATTFIEKFKLARHVSGCNFAHHQEH